MQVVCSITSLCFITKYHYKVNIFVIITKQYCKNLKCIQKMLEQILCCYAGLYLP